MIRTIGMIAGIGLAILPFAMFSYALGFPLGGFLLGVMAGMSAVGTGILVWIMGAERW